MKACHRGLRYSLLLTLGAMALAEDAAAPTTGAKIWKKQATEEIQGLLTVARKSAADKNWEDAEAAYHKILSLSVPDSEKRMALLEMGRMFESQKAFPKAVLAYESFLERFRDDPAAADVSIRLGRACRELGAFQSALGKFYNALHSSLHSANEETTTEQKKLALQAQFEIAETHFARGSYPEARRFYDRLTLLEMSVPDRELVQARLAYTTYLAGDLGEAVALNRRFIAEHPVSERAGESYYLLAKSLQKLGRYDEAAKETLNLLKTEKARQPLATGQWQRWQKRTGNEVASELYEQGDVMNALTIYQSVAELDASPASRWPAVYQIGLCFERLRLFDRALEAYTYLTSAEAPKKEAASSPLADPGALQEMAQWRMEYLRWVTNADRQLGSVLKPDWQTAGIKPLKFREAPPEERPAPATASSH